MRARRIRLAVVAAVVAALAVGCSGTDAEEPPDPTPSADESTDDAEEDTGEEGPALTAAGLAVTDLDRSVAFYTALGMTEQSREQRTGVEEVYLGFEDEPTSLVLMRYTDGRTVEPSTYPGKIVFAVDDPNAFSAQVAASGGTVTVQPAPVPELAETIVGFARDPDGYLLEVNVSNGEGSRIIAVGIGVTDLAAAETFYTSTFGMMKLADFSLDELDEKVLSTSGGTAALVLMHWKDGREVVYADNPGKVSFAVKDPAAVVTALTGAGGRVEPAPAVDPTTGDAVDGLVTDPIGTVLELHPES